MSEWVRVVEVGPRDGLQNESTLVETATKIDFIDRLSETGLTMIEASSFVSPGAIPQLQDAEAVLQGLSQKAGVRYPVLVPNQKGLDRALAAGAQAIAVFASASETFSQKNIRCTIQESLEEYERVIQKAKSRGLWVRAYLSCVLGCPYEGKIPVSAVVSLAEALMERGADELSLGDTIGVGTPFAMKNLIKQCTAHLPTEKIAVHCHNTYGQALANVVAAIEQGVRIVDSSVAGLGGCPYAKGASGNLSTEDLLFCLEGLGMKTGVDLNRVVEVGDWITRTLQIPNRSQSALAILARK